MRGLGVSHEELFHAYRKAKADVFFEKSQPMAREFAEFESNLPGQLRRLITVLSAGKPRWFRDLGFIGGAYLAPKSLDFPQVPPRSAEAQHFSASDPEVLWRIRCKAGAPSARFRPVAHFTVAMQVVSALWTNLVGHRFDACLGAGVRGARIRRCGPRDGTGTVRPYHLDALGSFAPYLPAYSAWRNDGINAIRQELDRERPVIAVTMDLSKFFHSIDPRFILTPKFLRASRLEELTGRLSGRDRALTRQVVEAFETWARATWGKLEPDRGADAPLGVPVGTSAARIMANVLLIGLDRALGVDLSPVYYGRYVDDIFLVLRDPGGISDAAGLWAYVCSRVPILKRDGQCNLRLSLPYACESRLEFNAAKQRVFLLQGPSGRDMLATIEEKLAVLSSEWRLLPDLDRLNTSIAANILSSAPDGEEEPDSLRKADTVSVKRLGLALQLRAYETLARDLPPQEWAQPRRDFFAFLCRQVITPLRLFELNDYLPRTIGLAVFAGDWRGAQRLLRRIGKVLRLVERTTTRRNRAACRSWVAYREYLGAQVRGAVEKACTSYWNHALPPGNVAVAMRLISRISGDGEPKGTPRSLKRVSRQLFVRDLGWLPYKSAVLGQKPRGAGRAAVVPKAALPHSVAQRVSVLARFATAARTDASCLAPLILPTRPLTPLEITECVPECALNPPVWAEYVTALRGAVVRLVNGPITPDSGAPGPNMTYIPVRSPSQRPRVAVTSFLVDVKSWEAAVRGKPDLSFARYSRLVRLCNAITQASSRPTYVMFPELSIPRKWLPSVALHFLRSGVSVVAGAEYTLTRSGKRAVVTNDVMLYLTDARLGYGASCALIHRKQYPAHHEKDELRRCRGAVFDPASPSTKGRVYVHGGFSFGVLICSELTALDRREALRGHVDAVLVPSWNQDLESFASLIDASVLDVHCYALVANNRLHGDSRLRAPGKDVWERDLIRVRGGLDDYFVVGELKIDELRRFQSAPEPPKEGFKPTPEGYTIADWRRVTGP